MRQEPYDVDTNGGLLAERLHPVVVDATSTLYGGLRCISWPD